MSNQPSFEYFESDLVKHAVALWKLGRSAGEADFDVLRFGRDWPYAEAVLLQCLASKHAAVSDAALEQMQLRAQFQQQHPDRAHKIGAIGTAGTADLPLSAHEAQAAQAAQARRAAPAGPPPASATTSAAAATTGPNPDPAPARYLKSLR
jgi:hypothetical protein